MERMWIFVLLLSVACSQSSEVSKDSGVQDAGIDAGEAFQDSLDSLIDAQESIDTLDESWEAGKEPLTDSAGGDVGSDLSDHGSDLEITLQDGTSENSELNESDGELFVSVEDFAKILPGLWIKGDKRLEFNNVGEVFKDGWGVEFWITGNSNRFCFEYRTNPEGFHLWQDYLNVANQTCTNDSEPYLQGYSEEAFACSDGKLLSFDCFVEANAGGDTSSLAGTWYGFLRFGTDMNWEQHAYTFTLDASGTFELVDRHTMEPFQDVTIVYSGDWSFHQSTLSINCTKSVPDLDPLICPYQGDYLPLFTKQHGFRTIGWAPEWSRE